MRRSEVPYLTGEELSIYAHQPTQPKKRPSHNQYQTLASLLPPPFGSLGLAKCRPPPHHTMYTALRAG